MTDPVTVLVKVARRRSLIVPVLIGHASDGTPKYGHKSLGAGEIVAVAADEVETLLANGFITDMDDNVLPEVQVQNGALPSATVNGRDASVVGPR